MLFWFLFFTFQTDSVSRYDSSSTSSSDRYDSLLGRSASYSYLEDRKPYSSRLEKDDSTDFKKLYEQILAENEKLKAQLHDTNMELTDLKLQLEKATQRQERFADRSQLEMEKRERRALERRISEMEEELKMLPDLKADNQRLKDENGALIRVISKLSKQDRRQRSKAAGLAHSPVDHSGSHWTPEERTHGRLSFSDILPNALLSRSFVSFNFLPTPLVIKTIVSC